MSGRVRARAVELLRCAADLVVQGEPFAVLEAERRLGLTADDEADRVARAALDHVGGPRTEVQLLEASVALDAGWSPP